MRSIPSISKKAVSSLAALIILLLCAASYAEGPQENEKYVRELIIRLNNSYIQLDRALKELDDTVRDFPNTNIYISVLKRDRTIELVSMEVWGNDEILKSHIYAPLENSALEGGGRHELFSGEIRRGNQVLKIIYHWREGTAPPQKEVMVLPITVSAAKSYVIELFFEKKKDKLVVSHTQLDFSSR